MKGRSDSFTDEGECKMKRRINPVCGIIAVLCIATMFVPSIMARESEFGGYAHFVSPAVFLIKRATSGFYSSEPIWKVFAILLLVNIALLAVWCVFSFGNKKKIGKKGIAAAIVYLITVTLITEISLDVQSSPFNAGIIVSAVLAVVAIAVAIMQKKALTQAAKKCNGKVRKQYDVLLYTGRQICNCRK